MSSLKVYRAKMSSVAELIPSFEMLPPVSGYWLLVAGCWMVNTFPKEGLRVIVECQPEVPVKPPLTYLRPPFLQEARLHFRESFLRSKTDQEKWPKAEDRNDQQRGNP